MSKFGDVRRALFGHHSLCCLPPAVLTILGSPQSFLSVPKIKFFYFYVEFDGKLYFTRIKLLSTITKEQEQVFNSRDCYSIGLGWVHVGLGSCWVNLTWWGPRGPKIKMPFLGGVRAEGQRVSSRDPRKCLGIAIFGFWVMGGSPPDEVPGPHQVVTPPYVTPPYFLCL